MVPQPVVRKRIGLSKKILLGAIASMVLSSIGVFGLYLYSVQGPDPSEQIEIALRLMSKGEEDAAVRIASNLKEEDFKKKSDVAKRHFILGSHERRRATKIEQRPIANELNAKAVEHLEASRSQKFPSGFEGLGNFNLGMALFDLFRWNDAEEPLTIASERWPAGRSDAIERLVDIDLSRDRLDTDSALQRIDHWRTLPRSSAYDDERATLKEMQTLLKIGDCEKAYSLSSQVAKDSPYRPMCELLSAQSKRESAKKATNPIDRDRELTEALDHIQNLVKTLQVPVSIRRHANLEQGKILREMGKPQESVSSLTVLRLSSPYEPESLAAAIEELEVLVDLGQDKQSLKTLTYLRDSLGELDWYVTDWLPVSEMKGRVVALVNRLIDQKKYSTAAGYVASLPKFCDELDKIRLESKLYEKWAESISEKSNDVAAKQEYHRKAGQAFELLSIKLPRAQENDDWQWSAITNYRTAGAFRESNLILDRYLSLQSRENRPKGHLVQAKNYIAMEDSPKATVALEQIINSNTVTPLVYEARLDLARMKVKEGLFPEAEQLILENLSGELRPENQIWRESLFEFGSMLYSRGEKQLLAIRNFLEENPSKALENFDKIEESTGLLMKSIDRMEDFLRRFNSDNRRFQLLYQMAKAYQLAAYWPETLLKESQTANEENTLSLKNQRKELLVKSRTTFRKLRQELMSESNVRVSNLNSNDLLRNSYFGEADLFFYEDDFEDARIAYEEASSRFINEPESLEARKQIALCYKKLGKIQDCRRTLEMARDLLQRIPKEKDHRFKVVTSYDRAGWEVYLASMIAELGPTN
ncbi:MAG: tetratricopeptide repeat protein [Pirellula sp.]